MGDEDRLTGAATRAPSTDGVEVAIHDLGGDGPPMLLAHATGFHAMVWAPMAPHLTGWHRIAPDLRCHGDTSIPDDLVLSWWGVAEDVLATIDAVGLDRPVGVGHSMGGAAVILAELLRPGTFAALWLYEPIVFPPHPPVPADQNPMVLAARKRRPWFPDRDEAYANYAAKPPLSELSPACLRAYVDHGFADADDDTVVLKCLPEREAQNYELGGHHGGFARLGELALPVTVAHGRVDHPGPASIAPAIAAEIADAHVRSYDDLAHFGPLADPARIAADIVTDLAGIR